MKFEKIFCKKLLKYFRKITLFSAHMESLLQTGESINVDDIENESKTSSSNNSKSSSVATDIEDYWDSPNSTQMSNVSKSLNAFDNLEMKRCKLCKHLTGHE